MNMILMDSNNVLAMNLGETYLVTENGNERLGKQKLDLVFLWASSTKSYKVSITKLNYNTHYNHRSPGGNRVYF